MGDGVDIDEANAFRSAAGVVRDSRGNNEVIEHFFSSPPLPGEKRITPGAPGSGVTAQYLGDGRRAGVLGAHGLPRRRLPGRRVPTTRCAPRRAVARLAVRLHLRVPLLVLPRSSLRPSRSVWVVQRRADVDRHAHHVDDQEAGSHRSTERRAASRRSSFFADHYSLGETLRRGAEMEQEIVTLDAAGDGASDRATARSAVVAQAMERARSQDCDDGLCCVPD